MVTVAAVDLRGQGPRATRTAAPRVLVAAPSSGGARSLTTTDLAGAAGYSAGDRRTSSFGGTSSAAAPQVSGVAALMLQANPNLCWRDVRTILAYAAEQPAGIATTTNGADHWNGGGLKFLERCRLRRRRCPHRRAPRRDLGRPEHLGERAQPQRRGSAGQDPDRRSSISYTFTVGQAINVETAEIRCRAPTRRSATHGAAVSPDGTVSTLLDHDGGSAAFQSFTFSSNAFLSEGGAGQWTLKVSEGAGAATGNFTGATRGAARRRCGQRRRHLRVHRRLWLPRLGPDVVHANSGHAVINAACDDEQRRHRPASGATSTIAGHAMTLSADSTVKTAYAGDGHVTLIANDLGNTLVGGHCTTTFVGGKASDVFVSGSGKQHRHRCGGQDRSSNPATTATGTSSSRDGSWQLIRADGKMDLVSGVSQVQFNDKTVVLDVQGNASAAALLYGAAFDRAPDAGGLVNWTNVLDNRQQPEVGGPAIRRLAGICPELRRQHQQHHLRARALRERPASGRRTRRALPTGRNALDHGVLDRPRC